MYITVRLSHLLLAVAVLGLILLVATSPGPVAQEADAGVRGVIVGPGEWRVQGISRGIQISRDTTSISIDQAGRVFISGARQGLTLKSSEGVTIEAEGDLKLAAGGNVTVEAKGAGASGGGTQDNEAAAALSLVSGADMSVSSAGDLRLAGANVNVQAAAEAQVEGGASAGLQSAGNTVVKGALVQLN